MADVLVLLDDDVALAGADRDRDDLVLELARALGSGRLVLGRHREFVLLLAGDLPLLGDVLGGDAHVIAVKGVPQAVLDHGVDKVEVAHLLAVAQMGAVRRLAHAFLAADDKDIAVAVLDRLGAQRHRAQAGAANLVHRPGRHFLRQAGAHGGLAGGVLAFAGGQDLAQDHLGHFLAADIGAGKRFGDRRLTQLVGGQA